MVVCTTAHDTESATDEVICEYGSILFYLSCILLP
ncbi:Uncharacterised protein [Segatella copri]|nr:Uncharacterised protein [Segatella copri]